MKQYKCFCIAHQQKGRKEVGWQSVKATLEPSRSALFHLQMKKYAPGAIASYLTAILGTQSSR
ncbi:hypothetical protein H6G17_29865 [Chroococcidiopsis sp. FACHB-1243]|uniref:hypothetical protein n=1 Tax=Chroococcidiopsis sp. [FACHB-1243] TaxID=2692781 RepID=UPI001786629B|nr:hypothetical protein [Chroococcidiopsis sp. [FACHB-1243]]MBD2309634.1 hypothetical protein [Chroococcidiopsis sp. [FACHB-1243]]